jgi:hypothetical protein
VGGVAARIATEEKSPAPLNLFQRIRLWLAPMFIAPRFSPALTAAMMLLAVGATVAVMKFADSGQTPPPVNIAAAPPSNRSRVDVIAPVNEARLLPLLRPSSPKRMRRSGWLEVHRLSANPLRSLSACAGKMRSKMSPTRSAKK